MVDPAPSGERLSRGKLYQPGARIAVIVLAVGTPPELAEAIDSLLSQNCPIEIVLVLMGAGDARGRLGARLDHLLLIEREAVLWPGAARNLGIRHSNAPLVAFLAQDCIAYPGWIATRLARHDAGAVAVGSALVPYIAGSGRRAAFYGWASHISLFVKRLPQLPPDKVIVYGASYRRSLFDRHGGFREDLRTGEDSEFHHRLAPGERPVWEPAVVTGHRAPESLGALIHNQISRGRRSALAVARIAGASRARAIVAVFSSYPDRVSLASDVAKSLDFGPDTSIVRRAAALLPLTAFLYCLGAASALLFPLKDPDARSAG